MDISNRIVIESAKIKNIPLFGQWQSNNDENDNFVFTNDVAKIRGDIIYNPKYKFKNVDTFMYLSEKDRNILKESLGSVPKDIDIISVYNDKNIFCDYINIDDNWGLIIINDEFIKVEKKKSVDSIKVQDIKEVGSEIKPSKYYNMQCGVLLGLKNKSGEYRTLWISFSNNLINKVYEVPGIVVARKKSLWKLSTAAIENSSDKILYSENISSTNNGDARNLKDNRVEFSEINFVSDDYIGIRLDNKEEFKVLPLDNIKNKEGVKLSEVLGVGYLNAFKNAFNSHLSVLEQENKDEFNSASVAETNYTMIRTNGHWIIKGRVNAKENPKDYFDFYINKSRQDKIIKFDDLYIPWNKAKEKNPRVRDIVNSPNKRMSIMLAKDKLFICEIKNGDFKTDISKTINIGEDDTVIMAEWAIGDFVSKWDEVIVKQNYKAY